jgi:hypothetical protein
LLQCCFYSLKIAQNWERGKPQKSFFRFIFRKVLSSLSIDEGCSSVCWRFTVKEAKTLTWESWENSRNMCTHKNWATNINITTIKLADNKWINLLAMIIFQLHPTCIIFKAMICLFNRMPKRAVTKIFFSWPTDHVKNGENNISKPNLFLLFVFSSFLRVFYYLPSKFVYLVWKYLMGNRV